MTPPEKGTYYAHPPPPLSLDCSDGESEAERIDWPQRSCDAKCPTVIVLLL